MFEFRSESVEAVPYSHHERYVSVLLSINSCGTGRDGQINGPQFELPSLPPLQPGAQSVRPLTQRDFYNSLQKPGCPLDVVESYFPLAVRSSVL